MPTRDSRNPAALRFYWVRYRSLSGRVTKLGPFDRTEVSEAEAFTAPGGGHYEVTPL